MTRGPGRRPPGSSATRAFALGPADGLVASLRSLALPLRPAPPASAPPSRRHHPDAHPPGARTQGRVPVRSAYRDLRSASHSLSHGQGAAIQPPPLRAPHRTDVFCFAKSRCVLGCALGPWLRFVRLELQSRCAAGGTPQEGKTNAAGGQGLRPWTKFPGGGGAGATEPRLRRFCSVQSGGGGRGGCSLGMAPPGDRNERGMR